MLSLQASIDWRAVATLIYDDTHPYGLGACFKIKSEAHPESGSTCFCRRSGLGSRSFFRRGFCQCRFSLLCQ